jgi:hypothetical protein
VRIAPIGLDGWRVSLSTPGQSLVHGCGSPTYSLEGSEPGVPDTFIGGLRMGVINSGDTAFVLMSAALVALMTPGHAFF